MMTQMLRILFVFIFVATLAVAGGAQNRRGSGIIDNTPLSSDPDDRNPSPMGDPQREVIARAMIARSIAAHRENLERAQETASIGAELRDFFASNRLLGRSELRKLERMENLSRRIRGAAGGSDVSIELESEPRDLADALERLAAGADQLHRTVERTPRRVVSATVIEQANELLELIRRIRGFTQQ